MTVITDPNSIEKPREGDISGTPPDPGSSVGRVLGKIRMFDLRSGSPMRSHDQSEKVR